MLGVPEERVNDDRLYRALDRLLPHKEAIETHLKEKIGELFDVDYDLLLHDVTSTYFEGMAEKNELAQRGYSRDHRGDCKQVCLALVVTREGLPLGYEVFAGNRVDVTTVEEIVSQMEERFGIADRVWVMDRGMVSRSNIQWLRSTGRRYLLGAGRNELKKWKPELLDEKDWEQVRDGLEVKLCRGPQGEETFILCRSTERLEKEKAMHERFAKLPCRPGVSGAPTREGSLAGGSQPGRATDRPPAGTQPSRSTSLPSRRPRGCESRQRPTARMEHRRRLGRMGSPQ
ncbi:MAG: IS1634 family transposase [Holophagales bacterium]|nr:IS1634 family transposase [Holophagales bacterium]